MMLTEMTTVSLAALPIQGFKDHLRLGSGFTDNGLQDGLLERHLRAAIAAIEGRIGKTLLTKRLKLTLNDWRGRDEQPLPVAPVTALVSVALIDAADVIIVLDPARYRLIADQQRPKLRGLGLSLPTVPNDGRAEVVFDAGFGPVWADIPPDLAQAVLLLATEYYEIRHEVDARVAGLPFAVQTLIERWRNVRVLGGGAA
ncbi:MAG: hypothetical protein V9G14_11275 [Cypionkella sp.]|nr:hypothetical protein [Cypionkella sp.]